ncbi:MAG: hypothetical protein ABIJ37_06475 [Pseudomonadota bacterium]
MKKLLLIACVFLFASVVIPPLSSCSSDENKKITIPMEKWVSPQGVVSVLKPKKWKVEENYTGNSASVVVCNNSRTTGVTFFVSRNDAGIKDSLYILGENVRQNRKKFPDFKCDKTWAARDRSKAVTDISFTAKGTPVLGKFYYFVNPNQLLIISYQAPSDLFPKYKGLLLTILNNINFYDQNEEKKRKQSTKQPSEKSIQPVQKQMVLRRATDGSVRFMAPVDWQYQAQKGRAIVGSEQEDAGFVFTSVEAFAKDPGVRVPGVLISRYLPPNQFIGLFLSNYGNAKNVQVIEQKPDHKTVQEAAQFLRAQCEAQDLVVKFSAKSGKACLASFKVITTYPAPFSGQWYSIVSGFWAQEDRFAAYAPLLENIAKSYQINEAWSRNYIQSGLANLRRLKQKTQQSIQELNQARYDQQRSWEANQARKDYSNWKFSQYLRDESSWVSNLEGGKVYHTDSWGTKDTWTGDYYEGSSYNYVNFEGKNPRHPSLEGMQEINNYDLYKKYIQGQ